ncbi:MAG: PAS domain-containing sensor histidine kinase [Lentimicrobium sp.]|nr:PAS domain-containing sensor histidine kinase [Lentimicrobium sp.]
MEDAGIQNNDTNFASAARATPIEIKSDFNLFSSDMYFQMYVAAMPDLAIVVNENRQIVYANKALLTLVGQDELEKIIGFRPGEVLECENLKQASNGCGTSRACMYCGIVNSVLDAQSTGESSVRESRIVSGKVNSGQSFDIEIKASPVLVSDRKFIILSIKDISDHKRRMILEKLFFHDILNTANGLKGIIQTIEDHENSGKMKHIIDAAKKTSGELVDEILAQRLLVSAETKDLVTDISRCNSKKILEDVSDYLEYHAIAIDKKIYIDPFLRNLYFDTDPTILKRVLINVVKNALEACETGGVIQMGCRMSDKYLNFWVNNPGMISESVQNQIFKHSFSTKGENRGIGTYSIKLLTTRYLEGNVSFETDLEKGTTFYINLPFSISKNH